MEASASQHSQTSRNAFVPVVLTLGIGSVVCSFAWGGNGARRVYFQIKHDQQIWFEVAGPSDRNRITEIGPVEPKTKWTRHYGDCITVER